MRTKGTSAAFCLKRRFERILLASHTLPAAEGMQKVAAVRCKLGLSCLLPRAECKTCIRRLTRVNVFEPSEHLVQEKLVMLCRKIVIRLDYLQKATPW